MIPSVPLGVDILEWKKASAFYRRHRAALSDILGPEEIAYVRTSPSPARAFARVFAAKEAVFKSLRASAGPAGGFLQVRLFPNKKFSYRLEGALKKGPRRSLPGKVTFIQSRSHVIALCAGT